MQRGLISFYSPYPSTITVNIERCLMIAGPMGADADHASDDGQL